MAQGQPHRLLAVHGSRIQHVYTHESRSVPSDAHVAPKEDSPRSPNAASDAYATIPERFGSSDVADYDPDSPKSTNTKPTSSPISGTSSSSDGALEARLQSLLAFGKQKEPKSESGCKKVEPQSGPHTDKSAPSQNPNQQVLRLHASRWWWCWYL